MDAPAKPEVARRESLQGDGVRPDPEVSSAAISVTSRRSKRAHAEARVRVPRTLTSRAANALTPSLVEALELLSKLEAQRLLPLLERVLRKLCDKVSLGCAPHDSSPADWMRKLTRVSHAAGR